MPRGGEASHQAVRTTSWIGRVRDSVRDTSSDSLRDRSLDNPPDNSRDSLQDTPPDTARDNPRKHLALRPTASPAKIPEPWPTARLEITSCDVKLRCGAVGGDRVFPGQAPRCRPVRIASPPWS